METLGQDTDGDAVVLLLDKAEVLFQVWEKMGRKAYRPADGIRVLRDMFITVATDGGLSQDDRELRTAAIAGLVTALGGKESTDPEKLFSTPSADGAPRSVEPGGASALRRPPREERRLVGRVLLRRPPRRWKE